jgi:hypothetical protein
VQIHTVRNADFLSVAGSYTIYYAEINGAASFVTCKCLPLVLSVSYCHRKIFLDACLSCFCCSSILTRMRKNV